jgi:hypothetical protein
MRVEPFPRTNFVLTAPEQMLGDAMKSDHCTASHPEPTLIMMMAHDDGSGEHEEVFRPTSDRAQIITSER